MGLRTIEQYLEKLEKLYPHVPYAVIKRIEKKHKNENEMKEELSRLNAVYKTKY